MLHQLGVPIIGIPCLEDSYTLQKRLPLCFDDERDGLYYPIFGRALENFVIYCHGLDHIESDNIKTVVKLMNGTYQSSFTKDVTHIITENSIPSGEIDPYDLDKKFIISPTWIYDIWQKAEYIPEKEYTIKCFKGLKICASGMTKEMKSTLRDLVIENGGEFSLILDKSCTHLLIEEPYGRKYRYAKRWNIITLDPTWVYQSISSGFAYPVDEFLVHNQDMHLSIMSGDVEISGITSIDCTYSDRSQQNKIVEEVKKQFESNSIKDMDATTCEVDSNNSIDVLKSDEDNKIFSGCRMYFCNLLTSSLPMKAQKNGAIIEPTTDNATHIIVRRSKLTSDEEKIIKNAKKDAIIVKKSWISDCILMNRLMKVDEYLVHKENESDNLYLLPHALLKAKTIYNTNKYQQSSSLINTAQKISQTKLMSHRSLLTAMNQRKKMKRKQNLIDELLFPLQEEKKFESTDVHINDEIVSSGEPNRQSTKKRSISPTKETKLKKLSINMLDLGEKDINKKRSKKEDKNMKKSSTTPRKIKEYNTIGDSHKHILCSQIKENELVIPDSYIPSSLTPPTENPVSSEIENNNIDVHQDIHETNISPKQIIEEKSNVQQDTKNLTTISHIYPSYGSCLGGELVFVYCNNDPLNVRVAFDDVPARTGRENQTDTICLWALTPSKEKASIVRVTLIDSNGQCVSHNDPPILFSYKAV